jgi:ferritin-like metal-binding protein YciE
LNYLWHDFTVLVSKFSIMATTKTKRPPASLKTTNKESSHAEPALMDLFVDSIKGIYWSENHLVKSLPKMQNAATSPDLAEAISQHLKMTKNHVSRLEEIFNLLDKNPQAKKCEAMDSLTREGEAIIEATLEGSATRDTGIIMAAQQVEHYEIATYGSLVQIATILGLTESADLLAQTWGEENEANQTLAEIAKTSINYEAASE